MEELTISIWQKFSSELKGFIRSRVKDDALADDLLQEVFIKIHSHINTLKDESRVRAWIYQICRNVIIDHYRKTKTTTSEIPEIFFFEDNSEENLTDKLAGTIREMIMQLPTKYAEPLCMNECDALPQKEIAAKLSLSLTGAKSRIQRGRRMIKEDLMKCCHYIFDSYGTLIDYHPISCCCCKEHSEK